MTRAGATSILQVVALLLCLSHTQGAWGARSAERPSSGASGAAALASRRAAPTTAPRPRGDRGAYAAQAQGDAAWPLVVTS